MSDEKKPGFSGATQRSVHVDGIVSGRDLQPVVRLMADNKQVAGLSPAMARNVAMDIMQHAARAEADAMIYKFFAKSNYPEGAAVALMMEFRKFRQELDSETVDRWETDPEDLPFQGDLQ